MWALLELWNGRSVSGDSVMGSTRRVHKGRAMNRERARSHRQPVEAARSQTLRMSIAKVTLVFVGSVAITLSGRAQNVGNWSVSGRVVDAATGRPVVGA